MAEPNGPKTERLRKLHSEFLESGETPGYERLHHVAIRCDDTSLWTIICGPADDEYNERNHPPDEVVYRFCDARDLLWKFILNGPSCDKALEHVVDLRHQFAISGTEWIGALTDSNLSPYSGDIEPFYQLVEDGWPDLFEAAGIVPTDLKDIQKTWLELLHEWFFQEPEHIRTKLMDERRDGCFPESAVQKALRMMHLRYSEDAIELSPILLSRLPWNVYLASAKAIEKLLEQDGKAGSHDPARVKARPSEDDAEKVEDVSGLEDGESPYTITPPNLFQWKDFEPVELPPLLFRLLAYLLNNRRAEVEDVTDAVWGDKDSDTEDSAIASAKSKLTTKLTEADIPISIAKKAGYIVLSIDG